MPTGSCGVCLNTAYTLLLSLFYSSTLSAALQVNEAFKCPLHAAVGHTASCSFC